MTTMSFFSSGQELSWNRHHFLPQARWQIGDILNCLLAETNPNFFIFASRHSWCKQDLFLQGPHPWIVVRTNILQRLLVLLNVGFFLIHFFCCHVNSKPFLPQFLDMCTDVQRFKKTHFTVDCILNRMVIAANWISKNLWKCTKKRRNN